MAPDRYTELFFLDEATALAAGHRPCYRVPHGSPYNAFVDAWSVGIMADVALDEGSAHGGIDRRAVA